MTTINTLYRENSADVNGGGFYNSGVDAYLENVSFVGNYTMLADKRGGAIYFNSAAAAPKTLFLKVTSGTSLFSGNYYNTNMAESLYLVNSSLAVTVNKGLTLDMRDPLESIGNGVTTVSLDGAGTWKLGGANLLSGDNTSFNLNAGTLYLYRDGEVANAITSNPAAKVAAGSITIGGANSTFNLMQGATLASGGGNTIAMTITDGNGVTTNTGSINLAAGATLAFDVGTRSTSNAGTAMLSFTAAQFSAGALKVDLLSLAKTTGNYVLAQTNVGTFSAPSTLTLRGENITQTRLGNNVTVSGGGTNQLTLKQNAALASTTLFWRAGSEWNATKDGNWYTANSGGTASKFLHGDIVNFALTGGATFNITNNAGGVQLAGMYVSGNGTYVFSGGGITGESTYGTSFTNGGAAVGKLVLGMVATGNGNTSSTSTAAFTGLVNFSGITGSNDFRGGVDIYSGRLRIKTAEHLGTSLSKLNMQGTASSDAAGGTGMVETIGAFQGKLQAFAATPGNVDLTELLTTRDAYLTAVSDAHLKTGLATLEIAQNAKVSFDGGGDTGGGLKTQLLTITTAANIYLDSQATLTFANNNTAGFGAAILVDAGAYLNLYRNGTDARYIFSNNISAQGHGAITSKGNLSIQSATFLNNKAVAEGGAIGTSGNNTLVLDDVLFRNNEAGTRGGAIANVGNAFITNTQFTGNTALTVGGGAIYNAGSSLTIIGIGSGNDLVKNTFIRSKAFGGGAIYSLSGALNISDADFISNSASAADANNGGGYGGAIYHATTTGSLTITGGEFTGNSSVVRGGAIYSLGGLTVSDSKFSNNNVTGDSAQGGAIYNYSGALNITGTTFEGNTVQAGGGAILLGSHELKVNGSVEGRSFSGDLNGNGKLIKQGDQTLVISAVQNNFTGDVTVENGTMQLTAQNVFARANAVRVLNDGKLNITADQVMKNLNSATDAVIDLNHNKPDVGKRQYCRPT